MNCDFLYDQVYLLLILICNMPKDRKKRTDVCSGEYSSGKRTGTTVIYRKNIGTKKVKYSIINGKAIFEGDIFLGDVDKLEAQAQVRANVISDIDYRWPEGTIRYGFDEDFTSQDKVLAAISHWEQNTSLRFQLLTIDDIFALNPGIIFSQEDDEDEGCHSAVMSFSSGVSGESTRNKS